MFAGSIMSAYLLTSLVAAGCDDDNAADNGSEHGDHDHDGANAAGASDHDHGDHDHGAGTAGEHSHDPSVMVGPLTGATCPDNSTLTYTNFGKQFFENYCLRCHSEKVTGDARMMAPADHNFDQLSDIDLLSMHIDEMAGSGPKATNTTMPPSDPKPTMEERQKLSEWIACGVKE
jgi:cytochrome c1